MPDFKTYSYLDFKSERVTLQSRKFSYTLPEVSESTRRRVLSRLDAHYSMRRRQPYGPNPRAGLSPAAHPTKAGRGMSRLHRTRNGRGLVVTGIPQARGGRRAHPPIVRRISPKINRKQGLYLRRIVLSLLANSRILVVSSDFIRYIGGKTRKLGLILDEYCPDSSLIIACRALRRASKNLQRVKAFSPDVENVSQLSKFLHHPPAFVLGQSELDQWFAKVNHV